VRHEFSKYFIVGFGGLFFDIGSLMLFKEFLKFSPTVSVVFNQILVLVINFTLNKYWSFSNKAMPHKQVVRYLILAGWNYLFAIFTMYLISEVMGYDYRIVRLGTIAMAVSWNFFLYKYWVYTGDAPSVTVEADVKISEDK